MERDFELKYIQIGLKVASYRKLRGLTQEELAERIGLTTTFVGHIEAPNMVTPISLETLFKISRELEIPEYKFLMFDE